MVVSKVRVALQKIKRTLIGVFQRIKQIVFQRKKEHPLPEKRKVQVKKGKQSLKTPKPQKSNLQKKAVKSNKQKPKGRSKGRPKKGTAVARGCGAIMKNRRKRTKRCG